jgi:phosphoribosylformimino-5-aminoimidazole carboxamide ribotide isomerase
VILGTTAAKNPELVHQACKSFPSQIAVGIDARDGMVAVDGWVKAETMTATDLALHFEDAGVAAIIYTDIERDGAMQGANIAQTSALAERISTPVIISGGVNGIADLRNIQAEQKISGAIVGRAFYEGAISYDDALGNQKNNTPS